MEILLRKLDDKSYVWTEAQWKDGKYYIDDDIFGPCAVEQVNILAVKNDERVNSVQCAYCGAIIENSPEAIEKHYAEQEAKKDCIHCSKMRINGDKMNVIVGFVANGDGTYKRTETSDVNLGCRIDYWTEDINSASAKRNCIYAQCRRKGVRTINDVFVKYPNLFDKFITVDLLESKKYQREEYANGRWRYDLKLRGTLKACVNEFGIVDYFLLTTRDFTYTLYYSPKYNKLFTQNWGRYHEDMSGVMSASKEQQILSKLSKLFEEENAND